MKKPNFLLFMTDQHRSDHLGCYGNEIVRTPHIDSIAARGTRFENFYVACPICMPNRIAMMTGRMPSANGSRHNGIPMDREAVSYVDLLRAAGYQTALIGKSHLQNATGRSVPIQPPEEGKTPPPEELSDATRERREGPDYEAESNPLWVQNPDREIALPHYGFGHVRLANGHGDQVHGHYDKWLLDRDPNGQNLRGRAASLPAPGLVAPQAWRTAIPEELYPSSFIADETVDFLNRHADEDADDPFFIQCSFPDPHHPFTPPGKYFDMYDPDTIPLPETFHTVGNDEHPFVTELRNNASLAHADAAGPRPYALTDETALRQSIALTYGMISMVDDCIGRILATLQERGLADDTVIIFTSDHGDFMGDHGLMLKHGLHYRGVLEVPFIWADTQGAGGGRVSEQLGSSIDIGACILSRAGLAAHNGMQGLDIVARPDPKALDRRRGLLVEEDELGVHLGSPKGMRTRTFINSDWRLTLFDGLEYGELFDLQNDPGETRNLWASDEYAGKRAALVEDMLRETIRLGDTAPRSVFLA